MATETNRTKLHGAVRTYRAFLITLALLTSFSALSILFSSCRHKDLCYHHKHYTKLRIEFDWRDAPDAWAEGMSVFFYPEDPTQEVIRFNFKGRQGGEIEVPQGRYKLLTYNNDTSGVQFSYTDDHEAHTAFTRSGEILEPLGIRSRAEDRAKLRAEGTEDENVVICPDMMWGCNAIDVEVTLLAPHILVCRNPKKTNGSVNRRSPLNMSSPSSLTS